MAYSYTMAIQVLGLVIPLLLSSCAAVEVPNNYIDSRCSNTSNYTTGSTFEQNMRAVLASLTMDAPSSGFSNNTAGQRPNQVYGLAQCRGDITGEGCRECIYNATIDVVKECPHSSDAIIWYEHCQLRSSANFFGVLNIKDYAGWYYRQEVGDPVAFPQKLDTLLNSLKSEATTKVSLFAIGNIVYKEPDMIYGLAQCTRDTPVLDCDRCLGVTIAVIEKDFGTKVGGELVTGSCRVRFAVSANPAPPPSSTSPPPPPSTSPPPPPSTSPPSSSHPPPPPPRTDKPNHSSATSAAMITVVTFVLMSTTYLLLMVPS